MLSGDGHTPIHLRAEGRLPNRHDASQASQCNRLVLEGSYGLR